MPTISVAIPAYNAEPYLRAALDSVLAQTLPPHEIIVVDDGSTDATAAIAQSYGDAIRYIRQANQGLAGARNTAIQAATGEWVAFFDSDDIMLPTKLEKQHALIAATPDLILCYTGFTYLQPDGSTQDAPAFPARSLWPALRYRTPILPSTTIIRRAALLEAGGFRHVVTEDWDLWFRLMQRYSPGQFREIAEPLLLYRITQGSLSKKHMNMASGNLWMLQNVTLSGLSGFRRELWKRRIEAKIFFNLSVALRERGDERYWAYAIDSMLRWPFFGRIVTPFRYIVLASMLKRKLTGFRASLRYWWPTRGCREELAALFAATKLDSRPPSALSGAPQSSRESLSETPVPRKQ